MPARRFHYGEPTIDDAHELCIADFVKRVSPEYDEPWHLEPFLNALEQAETEAVRAVVACPPQHGKTTIVNHWMVRRLRRNPKRRMVYVSNAAHPAQLQSRTMRRLYQLCGGSMSDDMNTIAQWKTSENGGLLATSIDGQFTGQPADDIVVDDPYKNRQDAENPEYREQVSEFIKSVCLPRLWPGGSFFLIATRWHEDDESGRLIAKGWPYINMPAIDDQGRALWPNRKPLEYLNSLRDPKSRDYIGEHDWESLFQGQPRPRSGGMFGILPRYNMLPSRPMRLALGVDLAYSDGKRSDWAVVVLMCEIDNSYYVIRVWRLQGSIVQVEDIIREAIAYAGGGDIPIVSYVAGAEKGTVAFLRIRGIKMLALPAMYNKYVRAQKCAEASREGRLLVPREADWLERYTKELLDFSGGPSDVTDDQVDGTVAAFDFLAATRAGASPKSFLMGRRCM